MPSIRALAFWLRELATGSPVRKHLRDIELFMNNDDASMRSDQLNVLLSRTAAEVPFYRDFSGVRELARFPVVDKELIRANRSDMVACQLDQRRLRTASTSGSTGTPFAVFQDRNKSQRIQAEAIFWGNLAGYSIGYQLYHLKIWSDRNRMSRLTQLARNVIPVDVIGMNELDSLELLEVMSRGRGNVSVISYASALHTIARALERREREGLASPGVRCASVIAQSEGLAPDARDTLARLLGCVPVSRYGLEELGIVAQQLPALDRPEYLINRASHVVEILEPDSDQHVAPGKTGRIVVTDLYNRAQPMIRYDTGDLGSFRVTDTGDHDRRFLATVQGRRLDQVFDADDQPLSPMVMYKLWWKYPEILQYQLVQNARATYIIRLKVDAGFSSQQKLIRDFRSYVGEAASVTIEITEDSFELSSGKRKSVVSHYRPGPVEGDLKK